MRNKKGITLVSLVVTIVILIILAGVSINLTLGENGIITMAKKARENMELAKVDEEKQLNELYEQIVTEGGSSGNTSDDAIIRLAEFKREIASAITEMGIETAENADASIMSSNIKNIFSERTKLDETVAATADNILEGKQAYVNGELIIGNGEDVNKKEHKIEKLIPQMEAESNEIGSISSSGNYTVNNGYPILNAFKPDNYSWISNHTRNPWIMFTWNKPVYIQATCFFTAEIYDPSTIGTITVQGRRHDTGEFVTLSTATINKTNTLSRMDLMFAEIDEQYLNVAFDAIKFLHDNGKSDYMQVSYINAFGYYAE